MKTALHLTRDALVLMPLLAIGAAAWGGVAFAQGVVVAGAVSVLNVLAIAWVVGRAAAAIESGRGGARAGALLAGKVLLVLPIYAALAAAFDAAAVIVGLAGVLVGLCIRGLRTAGASTDDRQMNAHTTVGS